MLIKHECKMNNTSNILISDPIQPDATDQLDSMDNKTEFCEKIWSGIFLTKNLLWISADIIKLHGFTHVILIDVDNIDKVITSNDFEVMELQFYNDIYLTTILPNCYKAVSFLDKALNKSGKILVIDKTDNQKCLTLVIGYLMYKFNLEFKKAFQVLIKNHPNVVLDSFFMAQLYEYEPILQVQRERLSGYSCSREHRSAFLKRKSIENDMSTSIKLTTDDDTAMDL